MPRTKRPVARKEQIAEDDDSAKKCLKLVNDIKSKLDSRALMEIRNVELAFKILVGSINSTYMQQTIGQLKSEMLLKEVPTARATRQSSRSTSHDDGYLTENTSQGSGEGPATKRRIPVPSSSRAQGSRSRSADPASRKLPPTASKTVQRRRSRSVYRTPAYNKGATCNYPAITPKVTPNSALSVLRQPRQGEMVVSMAGSPVMVPSCYALNPDEMANCNILLQDGTMLSVQPKLLRQSQAYLPFSLMDANVIGQLKTLKDNLDKVVKLGEKAMK